MVIQIRNERNRFEIDRRYDVIVDAIDNETGEAVCRTRFDAPEIDQTVRVEGDGTDEREVAP